MRIKFIIFLIFFPTILYSQNNLKYLGTLILSNNTPISFSLNLIEKNGIINGYSITNINTPNETKSEISGLYFKSDNSFQLQETQILETKSEAPFNSFCYINMNLSFKGKYGTKRLEGTFTGNFLDSTKCASGKIILLEQKKVKKKIEKIKKKIEKQYNNTHQDSILIQKVKILKNGDDFSINWQNKKLKLYIWDANKEDGDKIELRINNTLILEDFETKNKRKRVIYKLENGENIIEIRATNLGKSPPNTSRIELIDEKIKYPIVTQLEIDKTAIIKIVKK